VTPLAIRLSGAAVLLVATLLAQPGAAELRTLESVGVVPLKAGAGPQGPPRDAAERHALVSAVRRVAQEELPNFDPDRDTASLDAALGDKPLDYVTRYRILEDRGERPALFSSEPGVEIEYVVVMEVEVEANRVRERLRSSGLMAAPRVGPRRHRVRLVIEDVGTWASYRAVRTLLEDLGVQSAVPVEMQRGRAVLVVHSQRSPDGLMAALVRAAPPNLRLVPLGSDAETLRLRASFLRPPAAAGDDSSSDSSGE